jgi:hypothetical protein
MAQYFSRNTLVFSIDFQVHSDMIMIGNKHCTESLPATVNTGRHLGTTERYKGHGGRSCDGNRDSKTVVLLGVTATCNCTIGIGPDGKPWTQGESDSSGSSNLRAFGGVLIVDFAEIQPV